MKPIPTEAFSVTITEGDLQSAGPYGDCSDCLIGTAIKRIGYSSAQFGVGGFSVHFYEGNSIRAFIPDHPICHDSLCDGRDCYADSVVGKTFTFTPARRIP